MSGDPQDQEGVKLRKNLLGPPNFQHPQKFIVIVRIVLPPTNDSRDNHVPSLVSAISVRESFRRLIDRTILVVIRRFVLMIRNRRVGSIRIAGSSLVNVPIVL